MFLLLLTMAPMAQDEKKNGRIDLQMTDNDSMHVITATVTDVESARPMQNVELTFYVQRMFGVIKIANGTTDTTGIALVEFPKDLRADGTGTVIFMTKVEDNDVMNDTAIQMTLKPDFPYLKNKPIPRAMYGHYAPWWLVITFAVIVGTVSLLFAYVLYLVYRIKKASMKKVIT